MWKCLSRDLKADVNIFSSIKLNTSRKLALSRNVLTTHRFLVQNALLAWFGG